ncbi:MAG: hypothetical protein EZS28_024125 [Streblomastix strix]|uniref:Ubiquitin-like domain-containing protein n=1 Tax=Streblomastix strix TaxID=222440 RepID=A0A5J4VCX8_9EUKA|nr:MAG: hypothetical protein EZS28_024125 [Streblomastix strix]
MLLKIRDYRKPIYEVNVNSLYDTVDALKKSIAGIVGVEPENQRLVFAGQELNNQRTLQSYGVKEGDTINLVTNQPLVQVPRPNPIGDQEMTVTVKTMIGKDKQYTVKGTDTIQSLKIRVQDKEGFPDDQFFFVCNGCKPQEEKTIDECAIAADDILHMVMRYKGATHDISMEQYEEAVKQGKI